MREGDVGLALVVVLEAAEGDEGLLLSLLLLIMEVILLPSLRLLTSSSKSLLSLKFASRTLRSTPDNLSRSRAMSSE